MAFTHPLPLSERENEIMCAEEQNKEPFSVCVGVKDEPSPLPTQVMEEEEIRVEKKSPPPLPLFPLSKTNNGVVVLGDEWPSLPPRSSMQGMSPLPSLPPSGAKNGGGWMELFAKKDENSTDSSSVRLALSSQPRSHIKRMQPSPPLVLNPFHSTVKQQNPDRMVPPQLLAKMEHNSIEKTPSPPPVPIEEAEEKLSQPLYSAKELDIDEKKSKQVFQETLSNPFSLLADMEKEESTPKEVVKKSPSVQISKRRKRPRSKSLGKVDDQKPTSSFFITTLLLFTVPFLLVLLTSLKINI